MAKTGYIRVSTHDQNTGLQRDSLVCAKCEHIFEDKMSGTKASRPGLTQALKQLKPGDTLVVWKLDRLGRRVRDLVSLIARLQERDIYFQSLTDNIDTTTPAGRFFFHMMSALAEMEQELIAERTLAGLAAARLRGRYGGRPSALSQSQRQQIVRLLKKGHSRKELSLIYNVSLSTLYRHVPVNRK